MQPKPPTSNAETMARYKSELSEALYRINRLALTPYLLLISYLALFADGANYPEFADDMFVGRFVSMVTSTFAILFSFTAIHVKRFAGHGHPVAMVALWGVAFMIAHFAAVMENHFSAQTAWIIANIIIGGLYPIRFGWSVAILFVSCAYYLVMYLGVKQGPMDLQFQMTLLNSGIAGVTALAIKYGFIIIRKREFFSRVRLEQANQQIALLNDQLKDENLRMSHELDVARKIQHIVLPSGDDYRDFADLDIACVMVTADEVGGDYFDIIRFDGQQPLNGSTHAGPNAPTTRPGSEASPSARDHDRDFRTGGLIAIGDVTGHGLNSGVLMMMVHATLRALSEIERGDLKTIYRVINKILYDFRIKTEDTRIMTLALLRYFGDGKFTLTGEHECILRIKSSTTAHAAFQSKGPAGAATLEQPADATRPGFEIIPVEYGMYAGLEARISDEYLKIHEFTIEPGETIILYTDGITEAESREGVEFGQHGIINAACQAVAESVGNTDTSGGPGERQQTDPGTARRVCDAVMQAARAHAGAPDQDVLDDYSLVVIHRRSTPPRQSGSGGTS